MTRNLSESFLSMRLSFPKGIVYTPKWMLISFLDFSGRVIMGELSFFISGGPVVVLRGISIMDELEFNYDRSQPRA
jgi:hypothetical protein